MLVGFKFLLLLGFVLLDELVEEHDAEELFENDDDADDGETEEEAN